MKTFDQRGYTYKKHISTGGEGEVHLVEKDDKLYIAKIYDKLDENSFKLLNHIKEIHAPNVPEIFEIYNYNDKTILIRDYIDGQTLYDEIQKNDKLTFERAKFITLKICETLNTFHNLKPNPIIYRDLKPENIMISKKDKVFLIDFGIARYHKEEVTRDTVLAGTKGYTAPEVMAGMQSDNRSDIYSVGLIFYEMLTGKNLLVPPFQVRPVRESDDNLPKWVDSIIEKSTGVSMVARYKDIDEFVDNIKKPKKAKFSKSLIIIFGSLLLLLIIVISGIGIYDSIVIPNDTQVVSNKVDERDTAKEVENQADEQINIDALNYEVVLDLEFDDEEDTSWIKFSGNKIDYGDIVQVEESDMVHDGILEMKYEIDMKYTLFNDRFFHIRIKPDDKTQEGNPILLLSFRPQLQIDTGEAAYNIFFDNKALYASELRNNYGYFYKAVSGSPILVQNKWVDIIVYLDKNGETFRYFVSETGNEKLISYGGVKVFDEWIGSEYNIFTDIFFEAWEDERGEPAPISEIDFIKYGNGSVIKYLSENIPAYQNNKKKVDNFYNKEIEFITEDKFTQHGF